MILIVVQYALFAASIVAGKLILPYTKPIFLTGIRMFLGGVALLSFEHFHPHRKFKFHFEHIWYYLRLMFFGVYVTYILRFWALGSMPAFKMSFLYNLSPFMTSLYCYLFFKEKLTKKQWLGLCIGLIGMLPILLNSTPSEASLGEFLFISWPEIAVIISVATNSYSWIVMRELVREKSYSPVMVNGISMTAGGLLALLTSPIVEPLLPVTNTPYFIAGLIFIVIISNIICHNLYGHLLRHYSATLLSFAGFMTPLFTATYEWILYDAKITWHFYASCAIVLLGLFLFYQDELRPQIVKFDESPEA